MDPSVIIEDLLERIKGLTKENAFLKAGLAQAQANAPQEEAGEKNE